MKATGIVRRIDDLGRIVIPKEIRRTLRIKEGAPLEIYTNREGDILLKKYSPVEELGEFANSYAQSLSETSGMLVCITDRDYVIAAHGPGKKQYEGHPVTEDLGRVMEGRGSISAKTGEPSFKGIVIDEDGDFVCETISTIICNGDAIGSVVIIGKEENKYEEKTMRMLASSAANFLGRQME